MKSLSCALGLILLCVGSAGADEAADATAAIRKRVDEYVAAYNKHDAQTLGDLWAEDAVYLNRDTRKPIEGRPAITAMFDEMFKDGEADKLSVNVQSIRLITPDVAIEDGAAEITPTTGDPEKSSYTAIHVKKEGKWFLNSIRETTLPTASPEPPTELGELAWMVGDWVDQDENSAVRTHTDWAKGKHFLTSNFSVVVGEEVNFEGTQVIGWDPVAGTIRSWIFDSDGGFGEGVWDHVGDEWIVKTESVLCDGSQGSATNVYTPLDDDSFKWKSVNRQVDGDAQDDVPEVTVHRDHAPAKAPTETAAKSSDQQPS
jgi:uncharacterized protein (TIGR02246 family)